MKHQKKKELLLLATKLIEKILDARNAKEYYQSFLKNRTKKFVKRSKIITQQRNIPENPNIIDIKSVDIEHSKTSHKLSKTKRQAKKVFQEGAGKNFYSPLCSETTKRENILSKNNAKKKQKTKRSHIYTGYTNTSAYNSFNPEIQLKDTEYATRNKQTDLLNELKGCKFVMKLFL